MPVERRSVTPIVKLIRNIARRKRITESLRHADHVAKRTQPPPDVPGGPYHKSSNVYYYTRDVRRLVQPPIEIFSSNQLQERTSSANLITNPLKKLRLKDE